jgi:hypothetical protein
MVALGGVSSFTKKSFKIHIAQQVHLFFKYMIHVNSLYLVVWLKYDFFKVVCDTTELNRYQDTIVRQHNNQFIMGVFNMLM